MESGNWVIQKTINRFLSLPIDRAHEQNNEQVKSSGGAVGITENPSAFRKWMIAGPEQARLLMEFEQEFTPSFANKQLHHEEGFSNQKSFKEQTHNLAQASGEMGNLFLDAAPEFLVLDTRDVVKRICSDNCPYSGSIGQEAIQGL